MPHTYKGINSKYTSQHNKHSNKMQPESKGPGCLGWIQLLVMFIGIAALLSGQFIIGTAIIILGLAIGKHQYSQLHK